jgi:hypothetical protein
VESWKRSILAFTDPFVGPVCPKYVLNLQSSVNPVYLVLITLWLADSHRFIFQMPLGIYCIKSAGYYLTTSLSWSWMTETSEESWDKTKMCEKYMLQISCYLL